MIPSSPNCEKTWNSARPISSGQLRDGPALQRADLRLQVRHRVRDADGAARQPWRASPSP